MNKNIGFVGTRFAGLDGVSLESDKWDEVLQQMGYKTFWYGGELDKPASCSMLVPEAHFSYSVNNDLQKQLFGKKMRNREVTDSIYKQKEYLKETLYAFIKQFSIDILIAENCLAIPMQIPLALALTEVIAETGIFTIAHHHDFSWERDRFIVNAINDYLDMAFPPDLPGIRHVVINSVAQKQLAMRKGVPSVLIPNIIDFSQPPEVTIDPEKLKYFREDFDLDDDDILFLQPTRVVARKGIEHAISLVRRLNNPKIKLLVTHSAGDEGMDYYNWIMDNARENHIPILFLDNKLHTTKQEQRQERIYSLWDIYPNIDLITYPSLFEGFGNAFLEAVYYKKPILVNRYSIYIADIEPKGFDVISMEGFLTQGVVDRVNHIIMNKGSQKKMVDKNFKLAKKYFSYDTLKKRLKSLLFPFYGNND